MNTIKEKAMLVSLSISQWNGQKHDRNITREIEQTHHSKDAGRFVKNLVDQKEIRIVQAASNAVRQFHYDNTLPWDDTGRRLLATQNYFEYNTQISKLRDDFYKSADAIVGRFSDLVEKSKINLKGLFNPSEYPTTEELRSKFAIRFSVAPIGDASDFRVQLQQDELEGIRASIEADMKASIYKAQADIFRRVKETLSHLIDKLSQKDAIFRDTITGNIADLTELIPRLNFTEDPRIDQLCHDIKQLAIPADQLRQSDAEKAKAIQTATSILNTYNI